jgi:putative membrane protein
MLFTLAAAVTGVTTTGLLSGTVILATFLYAVIGMVVLAGSFWLWDKISPVDIWGEIVRGNQALARLASAVALGLAIIIAAAIVG